MLTKSKLNSIESKISEALINKEISHEDFMNIINDEKNIANYKKALEWWIRCWKKWLDWRRQKK